MPELTSFRISWTDYGYKVSIPNYDGGEVYNKADVDARIAELTTERDHALAELKKQDAVLMHGGWIEIPNDDTDLGDCFVGRWYPGKKPKFLAFQREGPRLGWVERQDFYTHYKPTSPPLVEHPEPPTTGENHHGNK